MNTVIVGGGFAGVKATLELAKKKLGRITLISDEPFFLHHATLYATATGRATAESVVTLKHIFADYENVKIIHDSMISIDPDRKLVVGKKKPYEYDTLIIAIGAVTTHFDIHGLNTHSFGVKTLKEVREFNHHLHQELIDDKHLNKHCVVIGAGPTGVELAGMLQTYLQQIAKAHHIKRAKVNILLVEAADRILPHSSKTASAKVQKQLEKIGVKVLTGHRVEALGKDFITVDGRKVATETAVWTSGVANHSFFSQHPEYFRLSDAGRVEVNQYLEAYRDIYVLGDNADTRFTGLARTALDDGMFIANHLQRKTTGQPLVSRHPHSPPTGYPIGDDWAYVEWFGVYTTGRIGSWLRRKMELSGYKELLPYDKALAAWRAHYQHEESCELCKK
jgi:NADH dehydrogenase